MASHKPLMEKNPARPVGDLRDGALKHWRQFCACLEALPLGPSMSGAPRRSRSRR